MQTPDEGQAQGRDNAPESPRRATEGAAEAVAPREAALGILRAEADGARARVDALTQQLATAEGPVRAVLMRQVELEQSRLANLQRQLDRAITGQASSGAQVPQGGNPGAGLSENELGAIFFVSAALAVVLFPVARAVGRWIDRRGTQAPRSPEADQRLERIEQAIEAVAIEVERVSEGQRYNTKLMAEMRGLPAPNPLAEWQGVAPREPVPIRTTE